MAFTTEQDQGNEQQQCIFCHLASGRVASKKVYEDDKVVGILDIHPANPGHVLLITKEHFVVMPQMPDDIVGHVGMVAKAISKAMLSAFKVEGTTILVANGMVAGQRASHFILHVIPRMEKDGVGLLLPEHGLKEEEAEKLQKLLVKGISAVLGKKIEISEAKKETVAPEEKPKEVKKPEPAKTEKVPAQKKTSAKPKKKTATKAKAGKKTKPVESDETDLDSIARLLTGG